MLKNQTNSDVTPRRATLPSGQAVAIHALKNYIKKHFAHHNHVETPYPPIKKHLPMHRICHMLKMY